MDKPTPKDTDAPGGWPETPMVTTAASQGAPTPNYFAAVRQTPSSATTITLGSTSSHPDNSSSAAAAAAAAATATATATTPSDEKSSRQQHPEYAPLKTTASATHRRPDTITNAQSHSNYQQADEDELFKSLSRRRTAKSDAEDRHDGNEIDRLMSRLFGQARQQSSQEENTRHSGVVWRNLTVRGVGIGASLQPTVGDIFMGLPRALHRLFASGPKAASAKPPVRTLIDNFDGCVRPGEMLLVLGRPGSGCSTFLKAFCNQRAGYHSVDGTVTYGGTDAKDMTKYFRGDHQYFPEEDLHFATLNVRNTLSFALQTRTPGKASRLDGESRESYQSEFLRMAVKLFWIEHVLDTKIGDAFTRGVSGGERKRVSIAEALITRASIQGWDGSSKGLDSSTANQYMRALRSLTNMAEISTAVCLYQAGESLYELVDKVLLVDQGKCLYFGPAEKAKQYFLDLGFVCPDRWTTADFLTSVVDEHERKTRPGWESRIPKTAADFDAAYRNSAAYRDNLADMADFEARAAQTKQEQDSQRTTDKGKIQKKNYEVSFGKQVAALTRRNFLVIVGDRASLWGKWFGILFQSLIVGSLFFNTPRSALGTYAIGGTLFYLILLNCLLSLAEQTSAFYARPIVLKHKAFQFYRPSAFAIAQTVVDVPLVFIQTILFNVIIYWMAGLSASASKFFIATFILWLVTMVTYAFFRALSAWTPSLDIATRVTGISLQILIVYTGYFIPVTSMKPWFAWLRFINPLQYGFEGLMANEFYDRTIECVPPFLVPQGPNAEPQYQSCTIAGGSPGSTTIDGAAYIQTSYTYTRAHLWRNVGFMCAFFCFFVFMTAVGMERMKPVSGGADLTVYKRGQVPKTVESAIASGGRDSNSKDDEEASKATADPTAQATDSSSSSSSSNSSSNNNNNNNNNNDGSNVKQDASDQTVFTFQNITYTIPTKTGQRKLLDNVSGFARPGTLTALMGSSGAGKTTLLNALSQRLDFGHVTGDFLADGRPLPKSFQRATAYAQQLDEGIHDPTATVREALQFSALLRQPREVPKQEKLDYCETIIDLLEMRPVAGAVIGTAGAGLNADQRKRLTIGVELAAKCSLLFLDEPTSGLDSASAFNVVRFLRKLTNAGISVICTIHQPSAVLFENFDELLLLKSGGRVVYHGELGKDSQTLIRYFEDNGARACHRAENPAEYMLTAIGAGDPNYDGPDWADTWEQSAQKQEQTRRIDELIRERQGVALSDRLQDKREFATPLATQLALVIQRTMRAYYRSPNYITGKMFLCIITALFNCFTFYKLGNSPIDFQNRIFSVFLALVIAPPLIQQLQPVFIGSRRIFEARESPAKIYSWKAWTAAAVLAEMPYAVVTAALYFNCWWWGVFGWNLSSFGSGFAFLLVLLYQFYYISFGQAIAAFAPNELVASLLVPVFFLFLASFCGAFLPPSSMPTFWEKWMYQIFCAFRFVIGAFIGVAIHDKPVECTPVEFARFPAPPNLTCESYTEAYVGQAGGYVRTGEGGLCEYCQYATGDEFGQRFNIAYRNIWRDFGIIIAFIAFNYFVVFFATYLRIKGRNPLKVYKQRKMAKAATAAKKQ